MSDQQDLFPPLSAQDLENPYHRQYSIPTQLGTDPNPDDPESLSEKERAVVDGVLGGLTKVDAGLAAGYDNGGQTVLQRPRVQNALAVALSAEGLNEERIATKIRKGLRAKKTMVIDGEAVDVPDHSAQHKYLTTLLELRGDLDSKKNIEEETWETLLFQVRARRGVV